jgi:hypothetical protein
VRPLATLGYALALRCVLNGGCRLLVVGGGFVGAEVAAAAGRRGSVVTVVEQREVLLGRPLGPVAGAAVTDLLRQARADLRMTTTLRALEGDARGAVRLAVLSDSTIVGVDVVSRDALLIALVETRMERFDEAVARWVDPDNDWPDQMCHAHIRATFNDAAISGGPWVDTSVQTALVGVTSVLKRAGQTPSGGTGRWRPTGCTRSTSELSPALWRVGRWPTCSTAPFLTRAPGKSCATCSSWAPDARAPASSDCPG